MSVSCLRKSVATVIASHVKRRLLHQHLCSLLFRSAVFNIRAAHPRFTSHLNMDTESIARRAEHKLHFERLKMPRLLMQMLEALTIRQWFHPNIIYGAKAGYRGSRQLIVCRNTNKVNWMTRTPNSALYMSFATVNEMICVLITSQLP